MKQRTGFTLVETGVVVAVAVLGVILVASPGGCGIPANRKLARLASCKANLRSIGKALGAYTGTFSDQWPWLLSDNNWDAPTGAAQTAAPSTGTTYNVSAILFILVRNNESPGIFVCPSSGDTPDFNTKTGADHNWDFSPYRAGGAEHVSYSYQAPIREANGGWRSGVNAYSDAGLVIAADRTPTYAGLNATFNWADPGKADPKTGMGQNHESGEIINLLHQDLHVADGTRADVGIHKDNIYSSANSRRDPPSPATEQGPGTLDITTHRSSKDSFLLGPKRMP